jgi:arsenate reductase (thioredoxin)
MSKARILFICTHNSARSQMAEGLLRYIYGAHYEVFSAGTDPTNLNPLAVKVMAEIGIDITTQHSKVLEEFSEKEIDLAVSVCQSSAKTLCILCSSPFTMGRPLVINAKLHKTKNYLVHGFQDPAEAEGTEDEKMAAFRNIRDQLKQWITEFFADPKLAIQSSGPVEKPKLT